MLTLLGLPICLVLAYFRCSRQDAKGLYHWPRWAWIWDNDQDGVHPAWYAKQWADWSAWHISFTWTALRNPCNNLRFVRGVSLKGRPLWRKEWLMRNPELDVFVLTMKWLPFGLPIPIGLHWSIPKRYYAQAGWNSSGYPVLSAGRNVNPW